MELHGELSGKIKIQEEGEANWTQVKGWRPSSTKKYFWSETGSWHDEVDFAWADVSHWLNSEASLSLTAH